MLLNIPLNKLLLLFNTRLLSSLVEVIYERLYIFLGGEGFTCTCEADLIALFPCFSKILLIISDKSVSSKSANY